MRHYLVSLLLLFVITSGYSQILEKPRLITGPFVGSVTTNSAKVWLAYKGNGRDMLTLVDTVDKTVYHASNMHSINDRHGSFSLIMDFTGLKPDRVYSTEFLFQGLAPHPKCFFRTQADTAVKDMNFIFGSCALLQTDISRLVFPGFSVRIFTAMKKEKSDFMVWLGDNLYYFSKHYNSYDGMFKRNMSIRNMYFSLGEFLARQPNYAIWDDHDYGWNDSDKKFPLKDTSLAVFKGFWPNPYDEKDTMKGNFFTFRYYDAEFFMTDDRWYRDPEGDTTGAFLGKEQLKWLENKLAKSDATFKFLCIGSQVLNDCNYGESYAKYPVERRQLLDYIANNNIRGVIFLTGDKHYSELSKQVYKGYTFYDFTSSPITSPVVPVKYMHGYHNNCSLPEYSYYKRNYGKISLTGPKGNRSCKMEIYGKGGQKKWEYIVNANDIGVKK